MNEKIELREFTRKEHREIRRLVTSICANYDKQYGCLPLDSGCYMMSKWYTCAYCKYFKNAVLPLNLELEAALLSKNKIMVTKPCAVCGALFIPKGRKTYCSDTCRVIGSRNLERRKKRNQRRLSRFNE